VRIDEYLFTRNAIALQAEAGDWQQAVAVGVSLLEAAGAVEARYYDAILANVAAHGPYFVLVPGFAMPHARPEDGVRATGFSLVTLKTPVAFGHPEHDPVSVVLSIAAASKADLNEGVIVQVMQLLDWEPALERLRQARSWDDLRQLFADLPQEE
jgi:ascorbate PTS system EIIA or EIIAB component